MFTRPHAVAPVGVDPVRLASPAGTANPTAPDRVTVVLEAKRVRLATSASQAGSDAKPPTVHATRQDLFSLLPEEIRCKLVDTAAAMGVDRGTMALVSRAFLRTTVDTAGDVLVHAYNRQVQLEQPHLAPTQYLALREAAAFLGNSTQISLETACLPGLRAALQIWLEAEGQRPEEDRAEAARRIERSCTQAETSLDLSNLSLTSLPESLWWLTYLQELDLSYNPINSLATQLGKLAALTFLDLSYTDLTEVPLALGELTALKILSFESTPISAFSKPFAELKALINLDLSGTQIQLLPNTIGDLRSLAELRMSRTPLVHISGAIGQLARLRTLHLDDSRIEVLPDALAELRALSDLKVNRDCLQAWPKGLDHLLASDDQAY